MFAFDSPWFESWIGFIQTLPPSHSLVPYHVFIRAIGNGRHNGCLISVMSVSGLRVSWNHPYDNVDIVDTEWINKMHGIAIENRIKLAYHYIVYISLLEIRISRNMNWCVRYDSLPFFFCWRVSLLRTLDVCVGDLTFAAGRRFHLISHSPQIVRSLCSGRVFLLCHLCHLISRGANSHLHYARRTTNSPNQYETLRLNDCSW